jgi:hypothetical protein
MIATLYCQLLKPAPNTGMPRWAVPRCAVLRGLCCMLLWYSVEYMCCAPLCCAAPAVLHVAWVLCVGHVQQHAVLDGYPDAYQHVECHVSLNTPCPEIAHHLRQLLHTEVCSTAAGTGSHQMDGYRTTPRLHTHTYTRRPTTAAGSAHKPLICMHP